MKKVLIITAAMTFGLFIKTNVQGQQGNFPSQEEMLKRTMTELTKEVELTDEEKASVEEVFTDFFTEMGKMMSEGGMPDRTKMESLVEKRDEKVKDVLPKEKFEAYTKYMENRMRERRGNPPPPQN